MRAAVRERQTARLPRVPLMFATAAAITVGLGTLVRLRRSRRPDRSRVPAHVNVLAADVAP